jgi:hypothetical protein
VVRGRAWAPGARGTPATPLLSRAACQRLWVERTLGRGGAARLAVVEPANGASASPTGSKVSCQPDPRLGWLPLRLPKADRSRGPTEAMAGVRSITSTGSAPVKWHRSSRMASSSSLLAPAGAVQCASERQRQRDRERQRG